MNRVQVIHSMFPNFVCVLSLTLLFWLPADVNANGCLMNDDAFFFSRVFLNFIFGRKMKKSNVTYTMVYSLTRTHRTLSPVRSAHFPGIWCGACGVRTQIEFYWVQQKNKIWLQLCANRLDSIRANKCIHRKCILHSHHNVCTCLCLLIFKSKYA